MSFAPIILFVYNRPWHTRLALSALKQNELADQSVVYIYADGPKENATDEDLNRIEEVRRLIKSELWCKSVSIIESEKNRGLANSIIDGVTKTLKKHGKAIVLEDDIVTSKQFLPFLNGALDYYEEEEIVFGISGFTYPSGTPLTETHCLPIGCSWGWATWESRWEKVSMDAVYLEKKISEKKLQPSFNFGNYPFYEMLNDQIEGRVNSWAIRFYASMFLNNGLFVYPKNSLVKNIGFGAEGSHTTMPDDFFDKVSNEKVEIIFKEPVINLNAESIRSKFEQQFGGQQALQMADKRNFVKKVYHKIKKIIS